MLISGASWVASFKGTIKEFNNGQHMIMLKDSRAIQQSYTALADVALPADLVFGKK